MSTTKRALLGCLGTIGLVVGIGTLVVLNWDAVSENFGAALDARSVKTRATLFRLGEVMSIGADLKREYGTEPDVAYDTSTRSRTLIITFSEYQLPDEVAAEDHAREIAAFAIGKTTKFEEIDTIQVLFQASTTNSEGYSFARGELMPAEP